MVTIRITIRISVNESERVEVVGTRSGDGRDREGGGKRERVRRKGVHTRICASDKGRLQSGENLVKRGRPLALWLYMVASAACMRFPCISARLAAALRASMLT